jgi:hypothetical protein
VASLAAAIFSPNFDSKHDAEEQGQDDISTDLLEWIGLDNVTHTYTHMHHLLLFSSSL